MIAVIAAATASFDSVFFYQYIEDGCKETSDIRRFSSMVSEAKNR